MRLDESSFNRPGVACLVQANQLQQVQVQGMLVLAAWMKVAKAMAWISMSMSMSLAYRLVRSASRRL
jgi:hypothetical protein